MKTMNKPSLFIGYPWSSVLQKSESEIVAQNIMKILKKTGNRFRELAWKEYKAVRVKDGNFSPAEKEHFDLVIPYCKNADTAKLFCHNWTN